MKVSNINIISPNIFNEPYSEAEVLGSMLYLWNQQDYYRQISIESAFDLVIPMIKTKQFALFSKDNFPIGYICWAFMNEVTEQDYFQNNGEIERFVTCNNGENLWILSLFSPLGYSKTIYQLMREYIFPNHHAKSLYHRGKEKGFKILNFYGINYEKKRD